MENIDFIKWLEEKYIENHPETTKDNVESRFDAWLSQQEMSDIMTWADIYGGQMYLTGQKALLEEIADKNNIKL